MSSILSRDLSPNVDFTNSDNLLPKFCCKSVAEDCFDDNSYLKSNQLKLLLESDNQYCNYWANESTVCLFEGIDFDFNGFDCNHLDVCFSFVKKFLNCLRMPSTGDNCESLRHQISTLLAAIRRRLFEMFIKPKPTDCQIDPNIRNEFCIAILFEWKSLLLFLGRLSQVPERRIPETSVYNYFHCFLDIWWTTIEVMYILDKNQSINWNGLALISNQMSGNQMCLQSIQLVLFDLIRLSVKSFKKLETTVECLSLSVCDCLCIKEMYVLIRHMFNAITSSSFNHLFLEEICLTLNLAQNSVSDKYLALRDFKTIAFGDNSTEDPSLCFIWFMTNIVQTFNYNMSGQYHQSEALPIPDSLLERIELFFDSNEKLSAIIIFCKNCINYWNPNTDILLPFVEYFIKNLNKNFSKTSVEELAVIPKTSVEWFELINEISSDRSNRFNDNNLYLFLSLMSQQLANVFKARESPTKPTDLSKFKEKVVKNLQSIPFESFSETGIFNLFSFYLVLMNTNEEMFTDFIDKAIETDEQLVSNQKHSELVLKFMSALLEIRPNGQKVNDFIEKHFK